jgi:ACR3 family arsenite transporter
LTSRGLIIVSILIDELNDGWMTSSVKSAILRAIGMIFISMRREIKTYFLRAGLVCNIEGHRTVTAARDSRRERLSKSRPDVSTMNLFERYLSLWVALCIVAGVALGHLLPGLFATIASAEIARVNLPVAALVWLMIIPMLLKIDFGALGQVREHWRGVGVTLFINWAVKPFSMALLGSIFIGHLFAPLLPSAQIPSYIAGLILLAAAPCTAMVFVWSNLCEGEPHYTLSQVALNDVIMVFAFAPLVGLLLGVASIAVPWATLLISVVLYIVVPVIIAQLWRRALIASGPEALQRTLHALQPVSLVALLTTLVLLFGFQGEQIIAQPLVIVLLAVPILIQVYLNAGLAYWLSRRFGVAWCVAAPAALIGASNFFELAVAAAISLFGLDSGAALATVVGVLVEVPVMLSVVYLVKASRGWYEDGVSASGAIKEEAEV